jgi:hypothetical protein
VNISVRHGVRGQTCEFGIGLDDRGDLVADAVLQELREDIEGPRRSEGLVGIARTGKDRFGLRDRGVRACEPIGVRPSLGDLVRNDDLEETEQDLEVRGLPVDGLIEVRWDRDGLTRLGGVSADPDAGDIGFAGGLVVELLVGPVIVLDGPATGFGWCCGLIGALPVDRYAVGRFDGIGGHDGLLKTRKPGATAGLLGWMERRSG